MGSMLSQVKSSLKKGRPRRVFLYGTHGIGKSTFGACAEKPIFLPLETGIEDMDVQTFPVCTTATEAMNAITELATEKHDFKTLVVDSADWLEKLIWRQVCDEGGKDTIADFGFGKGYDSAATKTRDFVQALDYLHSRVGMWVIVIAHCKVERFENPMTESYDRYEPKLHKSVNGMWQEWADEVLFAGYKVFTKSSEEGFGRERTRAIGGGDRVLYTSERPSHLAKNRLGLPDELPLSFKAYNEAVQVAYARIEEETPF